MIGSLEILRMAKRMVTLALALAGTWGAASAYGYELLRDQVYAQRSFGPLKGDLYLPATDRVVPAVVMIHGGGWRDGDTDDMERFAKRVVGAGFAVFNVTYRLAPDHKFPAQLQDVRDAVRWLRVRAGEHNIDSGRIGAWGYSAGAHLAMLLGTVGENALPDADATAPSPRVTAVVAGAGPSDLRRYPDNHYVVDLMPDNADDALFELASPVAAVSGDDAPMFLYHGRNDKIVGFHNSLHMYEALQSAGVPVRLHELRFGHILSYLFGRDAVEAGIEFLHEQLQAGDASTSEQVIRPSNIAGISSGAH